MTTRTRFSPPAFIQDFPSDPKKQQKLEADWSTNIERWTQLAILGNPWNVQYDQNRVGYYDPTKTDVSNVSAPQPITWNAFPNRIDYYFSDKSQQQRWAWADLGNLPDIPDLNDPNKMVPYTPAGDRGWQDEYCEWSVTRKDGKIIRVDCTCENSEYWLTLWRIDPERVRQLYQDLVGQPVSLDDLTLKGDKGDVVIDPSTGAPAYDPLNKFNSSTTNGGAVHLVSGPNTLGAEIYLAAAATIMRLNHDGSDPDALIKCAKYGREYRNSDPHIGASVYGLARSKLRLTLTDPVGLYMSVSELNANKIMLPGRPPTPVPDCVKVIRGTTENNRGLHIRFELPENLASQGLTLSDLTVDGDPLQYGSQLVKLITMTLFGEGFGPYTPQPPQPCVENSPDPAPMVLAFLPKQIFDYQFKDRSLQVALTPRLARIVLNNPSRTYRFTLQASDMEKNATLVSSIANLTLTPQWDTYQAGTGDDAGTATVEVDISTNAFMPPGDVSLQIVNPGGKHGPPMPSALEIVDQIQPREGAADASAATEAVKQASGPAIRASKSRPRRR